ncbi:unnamed protein product [Rotaria sordida]|uniref:Uncharacterized protein n=1 Tax=Rotaria sordida TaxID=392033 RepID=A0A814HQK2_9BILA|nr:unnamed protein product [Rotaria sordida]CAF3642107.1 unnamed protein product [Rotaria sordida]
MQEQHIIKWLILFITIIKGVHSVDIFIKKTNDNNDENIEELQSFYDKPYEMPLFQTRYITIRINPNGLHHDQNKNNHHVVGFKFQVKSTNIRVVNVQKEVMVPTRIKNINDSNNILLEDLFILPSKNAHDHIFNAYPSPTLIYLKNAATIDIIWSIKSTMMGMTDLTFSLDVFYNDDTISSYTWSLNILVTQPKRLVDRLFYIILPFLIIFISIQMGILLDTKILIELVRKPTPVIVGFISQYGLMPFLAMAIAKIFRYSPLYSLALFVIGCCPGSGASNQWTLLFDGDVNLSAVMSFVSTASSFVMMPLYFYTIGRIYMRELSINVPFLGLLRSLALVVIPYSVGIGISHCSPKTRAIVETLVKPMMLFLLIFFLVFGTIVNWYLIVTIDLHTALTAPLLPYLGFIFGAVIAWICRLSWIHIKTVGIEAGIQNTGIAFMIMYYSFPQPYATQAIVVPLVVAFLTTKPFWLVYMIRSRVNKYKKRKELKKTENLITKVNNNNGEIILDNEKPSINNEQNNTQEEYVEMMEKFVK